MADYRVCACVLALALAPIGAQQAPGDSGVHIELRLAGDRQVFKVGEPIRLELVMSADQPGYQIETGGADDPSDVLSITPEDAVKRWPIRRGRDFFILQDLLPTPTVVGLVANYWASFDQPGLYTVSVKTNRLRESRRNGQARSSGRAEWRETNPVTFRVEATSADDEQMLLLSASALLRTSLTLKLEDQIRAAEELMFMPGDLGGREKYRWYKDLGQVSGNPANARLMLRRGLLMTPNPAGVLALVERDLSDLNLAASSDLINLAASLSLAVHSPEALMETARWVPAPPGTTDPFSIAQAKYLDMVHQNLDLRVGLVKLQSAAAILSLLDTQTPDDVVEMIVAGFESFPPDARVWLASSRWDVIRDERLGPVLRQTLDEVAPTSRSYLFPALIDVAPQLALEPIAEDLLDPARMLSADIVRKVPHGALSHLGPALLRVVVNLLDGSRNSVFRGEQKLEALAVIAGQEMVRDLRDLYDVRRWSLGPSARQRLLRYLLERDPDEGLPRTRAALAEGRDASLLWQLTEFGPTPALSDLLRDRLFDSDTTAVREAAVLLGRSGKEADRGSIQLRLEQWRVDRRQRLANGESLTDADGSFESEMIAVLALSPSWTLTPAERAAMVPDCVTEQCRATLRRQ